jgi:hypothetical protein
VDSRGVVKWRLDASQSILNYSDLPLDSPPRPPLRCGLAQAQATPGLRTLLLPTVSALLLLLAVVPNAKVLFLGSDYSHRLYVTIDLNILLAVVAAVYFGVRKRWIAALAAVILALDWLYMGAVNSVV